eukprot:TRINITY_DN20_c0_g1_i1.p1 TRINITY_DN20_c0_g1~~TRINITY_DN20_c0_g1_i1.p1  ORF type:complete len:293 (-),score=108.41 TRINITY_DN20_c0_g1_i1:101-979(-)
MATIRKNLRGHGTLLMGKNTQIRRALRELLPKRPELEVLIPRIKLNVGLVFTNEELTDLRQLLEENKVQSVARVGAVSPCDVMIPKGDTGLIPTETAFLQALQISSKINKGQIQILQPKLIIEKGEKVGQSEATLLKKLDIKPFKYGLEVLSCFSEGNMFDVAVLDITPESIIQHFSNGVRNVASVSLGIGLPTIASVPHSLKNAYKNVLHIFVTLETYEPTWEHGKTIKDMLENPDAYKSAVNSNVVNDNDEEKEPEEEEEEESEGEGGMGGLFGGGGSDSDSDEGGFGMF